MQPIQIVAKLFESLYAKRWVCQTVFWRNEANNKKSGSNNSAEKVFVLSSTNCRTGTICHLRRTDRQIKIGSTAIHRPTGNAEEIPDAEVFRVIAFFALYSQVIRVRIKVRIKAGVFANKAYDVCMIGE